VGDRHALEREPASDGQPNVSGYGGVVADREEQIRTSLILATICIAPLRLDAMTNAVPDGSKLFTRFVGGNGETAMPVSVQTTETVLLSQVSATDRTLHFCHGSYVGSRPADVKMRKIFVRLS
jgi:hypothetical protein